MMGCQILRNFFRGHFYHLLSSLTHTFVEYDQIIKLFVLITKRVEFFGCPVLFFIYFSLFLSLFFSEHTSIFNSVPLM